MSKSNVRYIATIAFCQGISQSIARHYINLDGRVKFKNMLIELYTKCDSIITTNKEKITDKEAELVKKAVSIMNDYGMENGRSYQTYLSFLVGIVSERLQELSNSKKASPKKAHLEDVLKILTPMYEYFEIRTRTDEFDRDALKLMNNFNLLF